MNEVDTFAVIGAGLVGVELATDLKSYYPEKEVVCYTRGSGWMPRIPGAHELIKEETDRQGIKLVTNKEIVGSSAKGNLITKSGEELDCGSGSLRTYWCTGYTPNNDYLLDARTDSDIRAELDPLGFVKVGKAYRMNNDKGLGHIFAGGDIVISERHAHGERTAASAWYHAGAILENILLASGKREGELKTAALGMFAGVDLLAVSLGTNAGLLYATSPYVGAFFQDQEACLAKYGKIEEAGAQGWQELSHGPGKGTVADMGSVNHVMFTMIPEGAYKMYMQNDMAIWQMFVTPVMMDLSALGGAEW